MNELGMLVDLSHCGDRTTAEAIERSKKPCAITHAGCRAVYATGRNKPDELLQALADKGGVVRRLQHVGVADGQAHGGARGRCWRTWTTR